MLALETARLGGVKLFSAEWLSATAILVRFTSLHAGWLHQVYVGRELAGATSTPAERSTVVRLVESEWPQRLTLLAVHPDALGVDFGQLLPLRPYNRARIRWTTSAWPADSKLIDVYTSATPGGAVDETSRLGRILFATDGSYELVTAPLPGSGYWPIRVRGVDDKPPAGNQGTSAETVTRLLSHPPDLVTNSAGERFDVDVVAGEATVTCVVP